MNPGEEGSRSVVDRIGRFGVVPVVELPTLELAVPLLTAFSRAGLGVVEVTLRTEAGIAAINALRSAFPDQLVGAGTVRNTLDAERAIDAGAQFVVSPSTNPDVIALCRAVAHRPRFGDLFLQPAAGVPALPGACTPSEVDLAMRCGASAVKFFPAEAAGGVAYLKALAAPYPEVRFIPTGGISPGNLADYLRQSSVLACGGTWLASPEALLEGRFERIEELAREALDMVAAVRGEAR